MPASPSPLPSADVVGSDPSDSAGLDPAALVGLDPTALAQLEPRLSGATPVIDVAHIAETIQVLVNAIEQLQRLNQLRDAAETNLKKLTRIPFVDDEDDTGEFLTTMQVILRGQDPVSHRFIEETVAYPSGDISAAFRRYFPGERILPGTGSGPSPWDVWDSEADFLTERYRAVLAALYRTMDIFSAHTTQGAHERRGIQFQRETAPSATGESQQAQMLLAALHQILDAQSVDRQLSMMRANTDLLVAAEEVNDRATALAKDRAFLAAQSALFAEAQPVTEASGTWISP